MEKQITSRTELTLHFSQPCYLFSPLLTPKTSLYSSRSSDWLILNIMCTVTALGRFTFSVTGSRLWNSLSSKVHSAKSALVFNSLVKAHLFVLPISSAGCLCGSLQGSLIGFQCDSPWILAWTAILHS